MSPAVISIESEEETLSLAARVARLCRGGELVILEGQLGAGKTFFAGGFARALGLDEEEAVVSPTFNLVVSYETAPPLEHADLYRLRHGDEVRELGLRERREEDAVLLVEWGSRFVAELGGDALLLEFSLEPRRVALTATGSRSSEILREFAAQSATGGAP